MDQDQFDEVPGNEGGEDQAAPTADHIDEDIKIHHTGQRVMAIIVALLAVGGAIAAIMWWQGQKAAVESHEKVKAEFSRVHTKGYTDFWIATQVDVKEMKTNEDFELKLKAMISEDPVRYGTYIKEKALPVIDAALPEYKAITVPAAYADKMEAMVKAAEGLREAWSGFSDELLKFEDYYKGKKLLDKCGNAWLGAQQSKDEKYQAKAYKYFKLLGCVLPDQKVEELDTTDINLTIKDSCAKADVKTAWFRRVAYECLPRLAEEAGEPDEAYEAALKKSRGAERMDHASKFGIEDCLKSSRDFLESDIIQAVALAWASYVKAQNELLAAIKAELEKLR
jgi:hypothetical protein